MAIVLNPKFPIPDRSKQKIHFGKDEGGVLDIGWCEGVLFDGRPFRAEMWAEDQISMLTFFFSTAGIEDVSVEQIAYVLEDEGLVTFPKIGSKRCQAVAIDDDAGNHLWSVNIAVGTEDETYLEKAVPIFPYSRVGEPNTMFNLVPIKAAQQGQPA